MGKKITLHKDGGLKIVDGDERIKMLKGLGWHEEGECKSNPDERTSLLDRAEELGISVHHKAGIDKIKAQIAEAEAELEG